MSQVKRYALVGTGGRSAMFSKALVNDYTDYGKLVAFCDMNQTRMDFYNKLYAEENGISPIATYKPDKFAHMIKEQKIDTVIVTTIDRTHHRYICAALENGCDAISEKPMTTDAEKCQQILDTIKRTGKKLTVTFNYRYAPRASKVKELLLEGVIGNVHSVHFEWLLDTKHGADYFRRWHRDKRNSGGLMVHKATHHFDLVNWWLGSQPKTVFGLGDLKFYGRENAENRGELRFYHRSTGNPHASSDPFALNLEGEDRLRGMYLDAEGEDGYIRDQSVFGDGISIEDDMAVLVRYRNKASMSYHLTAYSPWEGFNCMFNGTKGRLEFNVVERSYISGATGDHNTPDIDPSRLEIPVEEPIRIVVRPHWEKPHQIPMDEGSGEGGHGGGDKRLLDDLFIGRTETDPLGRAANHVDGAMSILTGVAANKSFNTGLPVDIDSLVQF